jgi:hypothetical protein
MLGTQKCVASSNVLCWCGQLSPASLRADHCRVVAAARRASASTDGPDGVTEPEDQAILNAVAFERVAGGMTNSVFRYQLAGQSYVLKLYRQTWQQGDDREWTGLRLLERHLPDSAPHPVLRDRSADPPAIVMSWVAGEPLGGCRLTDVQLTALRELLMALHSVTPKRCAGGVTREALGTFTTILARIQQNGEAGPAGLSTTPGGTSQKELRAIWSAWLRGPDPAVLVRPARAAYSRGDPNLMNCLWDGRGCDWWILSTVAGPTGRPI